ncbi:MAG: hypothetical protein AAFU85_12520 [Planctomycetota bacterium]
MLYLYGFYTFGIWLCSAALFLSVHFGSGSITNLGVALFYLVLLPSVFIAPSVELVVHVGESGRATLNRFLKNCEFAAVRLAASGLATAFVTFLLLCLSWHFGSRYTTSVTATVIILSVSLALAVVGPAAGLSITISRAKSILDE